MKKSDIVMIFEDPITEQKPKGKAELLILLDKDADFEYWTMRLIDSGELVNWTIKKPVEPTRKMLKCNECGKEYDDQKDFAYAEKMRKAWAKSQRADGKEPRGVCPCPNLTCNGELVEITK